MRRTYFIAFVFVIGFLFSCTNDKKENKPTSFLTAKEAVRLNQVIYKEHPAEAFLKYSPEYEVVFSPQAVEGNYAVIVKNKSSGQFALVVRGSLIEFSNEGFQNFVMQDFNIFTIKPWKYTDSIQEAYISNGAWIGFQNLLQLKDNSTGLGLKEFIEQKIPVAASLVITGHSLGGNLAYPLAGYLKDELNSNLKKNLQLITFGAPAAGNAAFVKDLEEKFPDAERYVTEKDIAPVFPDIDKMEEVARLTGLDRVLQISQLNLGGLEKEIDAGKILKIAGEILKKTNVINETNQYVQSKKHLRMLKDTRGISPDSSLSVEAIFNNAYQFHKIDMYAELLGAGKLD